MVYRMDEDFLLLEQGEAMDKKRVLVVDDSEIVLAMARNALEEGGFEVVTALSAKEADSFIFSDRSPDIIIMDVMLPTLDGDKKARMLKENEKTKHIPILLLSSKPDQELQRLTIESGSDGYIRKPFGHHVMAAKVRSVLDGKG